MPAYYDEKQKTWMVAFDYTDWRGERHQKKKRGFPRKKDALEFEREFKHKEHMSCDMTFASLSELYFADMGSRLRETTITNKRYLFNDKIIPFFGKLRVNEIQPAAIRQWQNELMSKGFAPTYLKTINNQLSAIFNWAVRYYHLPSNPCRIAGSMGRKKADEMLIWTTDEFQQFIAAVDRPAVRLAFQVMFWTGLRVGECLALTPADILPVKEIDVSKTTSRRDGEDRVYDPKTTKSARRVPIPDFLYAEIKAYIKGIYAIENNDRIFYFTKSNLNKNLDYFAERAGVKRIRVHDLRHSHASLLIEMGYGILLIAERLGHDNVETTWNTYGHLYPNKQRSLADDLNKFASPTGKPESK